MLDDINCGNAIISFVPHIQMNDVGHGIPLSPLDCTDGQTKSGVVGHHSSWTTHTVEKRRACHNIIALGRHIWSNDFGSGMSSWHLNSTYGQLNDVECGMSSLNLNNTDVRTKLAMEFCHCPLT